MHPNVDSLRQVVVSLRQFVVSPQVFFTERPPAETGIVAIGLVGLFSVCLVGALLFIGALFAGTVDATITMDNPEHTPSVFCDQPRDDPDSPLYDGCDVPETVERDAGTLIQEAVNGYAWIGIVGPAMLWFAAGVVLYGAGRIAGGTPSFGGTLSLAGWATVPEFARLAVGLVGLQIALGELTVTDVDQLETVVQSAIAPVEPILLVASFCAAVWQWHILSGGLAAEADISWPAASFSVAVPFCPFVFVSMLL